MSAEASSTCEYHLPVARVACGDPAVMAYPAMGGGWMSLCQKHGRRHEAYSLPIEDVIAGRVSTGDAHAKYCGRAPAPLPVKKRIRQHHRAIAKVLGLAPSTVYAYASISHHQPRLEAALKQVEARNG